MNSDIWKEKICNETLPAYDDDSERVGDEQHPGLHNFLLGLVHYCRQYGVDLDQELATARAVFHKDKRFNRRRGKNSVIKLPSDPRPWF